MKPHGPPYGQTTSDTAKWIGNELADYRQLIEQAATETGFPIACRDEAWDVRRLIIPGYIGVWTSEPCKDTDPFWDAYHRLKEAAEQEAES